MTRLLNSAARAAIALSLVQITAPATAESAPAQATSPIPTQLPRTVVPVSYKIAVTPDPENLRFTGSERVEIDVVEATDSITLNAVDLTFSSVTLTDAAGNARTPSATDLAPDDQTATFRFAGRLAPGRYTLAIDYAGKINTQAAGLFALDYDSAEGKKRALFTQFEAPDARRFMPSWDEPDFRTPYELSVTLPSNLMAVSNMPEARREDHANGTSTVTFQTTPPMSSYLLFLATGEFDRATADAAGTEVGVVTRKGEAGKAGLALAGAAELLPYYNDYFGTPYPLPKLDNIAGPGSSQFFSAMENWGAIFSFESILLVDPEITSEARRQGVYEVLAHEMAHQWFGDLVTMAWWDDLWLNEGFASWMATKATDHFHPEWEPKLGQIGTREAAMNLDSLSTTHPIVQKIATVEQISQAFDSITYSKGEAVITMLEDYVGEDAWRAGVRDYIATYRLDNTVTDNLWAKVEKAAGKPILAIAHDFTLQPGIPLIRVESATCAGGVTTARLAQGEFSRDNRDKQPLGWRVPVIAATVGGAPVRTLVEGGRATVAAQGCAPLIVNSGQTGYYRTLYAPALLDALTAGYATLAPIDQIGLLADNWSLGLAGYQPASEALDLIDAVPADANPQLWSRVAGILASIHDRYEGDAASQALVSRYATARLGPVFERIGWTAREGERDTDAVLRASLIATLGELGDPAVSAEARRRFDLLQTDPKAIDGPLRSTILGVVAANADTATWDRLHAMAMAEKSPMVRNQLYSLLASTRDEALARRALALALTDEPGATNSAAMISAAGGYHPDLAYDFAVQNRAKVAAFVDASSQSRFLPRIGGRSSDPAMIAKLEDYARHHLTPQSRKPVDTAIAGIRDRNRVRQERLPDVSRWLTAHASAARADRR